MIMPVHWTSIQENKKRAELIVLYVRKNKSLGEIAKALSVSPATVYDRLIRFNIPTARENKLGYNNQRKDILIPKRHSAELAEFIGIMLGDGNLTPTQVAVTLGIKDIYVDHVSKLVRRLFGVKPNIIRNKYGHQTVYFGSVKVVRWLKQMGLVHNKVKMQVDVPRWIFGKKAYMRSTLRGLIDTDGSIYKLRWGIQISFCNRSIPLLNSFRKMFIKLDFHPSEISGYNVYLTRKQEVGRFLTEIGFANRKHLQRYKRFGCVA